MTMAQVDIISRVPRAKRRELPARALSGEMAACAEIAKQRGFDYWDGDPKYGFGGYHFDGRWRQVAEAFAEHYGLKAGQRVLEIGCGKGFLLYELTQAVPGLEVAGVDISRYAIDNAKPEVKSCLHLADCTRLPFDDASFDLVIAIKTLRDLKNFELFAAVQEIQRVGRGHRFICDESYRSEEEKVRALFHQLTWESLYTPAEWDWFLAQAGYRGDTDFVFFE
jgi:SAM-dependent methyltransferase